MSYVASSVHFSKLTLGFCIANKHVSDLAMRFRIKTLTSGSHDQLTLAPPSLNPVIILSCDLREWIIFAGEDKRSLFFPPTHFPHRCILFVKKKELPELRPPFCLTLDSVCGSCDVRETRWFEYQFLS